MLNALCFVGGLLVGFVVTAVGYNAIHDGDTADAYAQGYEDGLEDGYGDRKSGQL